MLAQGTIDVPRLAKAAALRAAPHDLDGRPVVHHVHVRHREPPVIHLIQPDSRALPNHFAGRVQGGNVHPLDPSQRPEQLLAAAPRALPVADGGGELKCRLLAVADQKGIDELRQGFGGARHGAAGAHERVSLVPLRGPHRHTTQFQHGQDRSE